MTKKMKTYELYLVVLIYDKAYYFYLSMVNSDQ